MKSFSKQFQVVGSAKPSVPKREALGPVGYISKRMLPLYFKFLVWVFSQNNNTCFYFQRRLLAIWDKNGSAFLVKYLKECYLIVQKYVSGVQVGATKALPLALKGGLPQIVPGPLRSEIRKGNPVAIRFTLTALAVFRIIKCPGNLKLSTITEPFSGVTERLPDYEVSLALRSLFGRPRKLSFLKEPRYLFLTTAGPNLPVSWTGTWLDIKAWSISPSLPHLLKFIERSGWNETRFGSTLLHELRYMRELQSTLSDLVLGKLHQKEEAAGKVRIFAITDSITQAVLAPLHDFLFDVLRKLDTDGTHDQGAPLQRLLDLKKTGAISSSSSFWSYDLSAATDRFPVRFQEQCLALFFGDEQFAESWRLLLCDRDWVTPWDGGSVRFAVGQPMGALSSWAMLAFAHHVVVRIAAQRVGIKDFDHYALLGDDIVIANDSVAKTYHHLMTEILGVEINLDKSLVSLTHFEYAKRLVSIDHELSPIGPKNLLIALSTPYGIISVLRDMVAKGSYLDESTWDALSKKVPYYRKSSIRSLEWAIKGPFGLIPTEAGLSPSIRLDNSLTSVAVDMLITAIDDELFSEEDRVWSREQRALASIVRSFEVKPVGTYLTYGPPKSGSDVSRFLMNAYLGNPEWTRYHLSDSALYFYMRELILDKHTRLIDSKPVRRFIYNGPLIHFNMYRADWLPTVMSYIRSKIDGFERIAPPLNPFAVKTVSTQSLVAFRGIRFFKRVHQNWEERRKMPRTRYF